MIPRSPPLTAYQAITWLLAPAGRLILRDRARRGKEDPERLGERLGRPSIPRPAGPLVWLHAVSVGESLSLLPLIEALVERRPDLGLIVTSGTRTSAELLARRLPRGVIHQYAPIDTPQACRAFFEAWRPGLGVIVESEIWPNLVFAARRRSIPMVLLSARISPASAKGWARVPGAARELLDAFSLICPQDDATRLRLEGLGGGCGPALNLKLTGKAPPANAAEVESLRGRIGNRRVVLAASTHPEEEVLIAGLFTAGARADDLLILAPRHPDRAGDIAAALSGLGLVVARRSLGEEPEPGVQVYLADTLGELGLLMRLSPIVVMGGSLVPGVGGHNPMEAARLGLAILTGPLIHNAEALYAGLVACGGARIAPDAESLGHELQSLLADTARAQAMGRAAIAYARDQAHALDQALDLLKPLLPR